MAAHKLNTAYFVLILAVLILKPAYSAPAYGTHMPKAKHWTWGAEAKVLKDRNLDNDEGALKGKRYFLTGSYSFFEWLCIDGKIGAGDVKWDRNKADDLNYSTNFAGAYGFRVKCFENKEYGINIVTGFQHISVHPNSKTQGNDKNEAIVDEWQGSIVMSKAIGSFVPYIGGRFGTMDLIKKTNEHDRKRIKSEKNYGLILGFDYWLSKNIKLNLEGAFVDGEEVALGVSRDF